MGKLQEENFNKEVASDSMCMFLAMNTAGFQLVPATVLAVLVGVGYSEPTKVILPTLIVSCLSFIFAILRTRVVGYCSVGTLTLSLRRALCRPPAVPPPRLQLGLVLLTVVGLAPSLFVLLMSRERLLCPRPVD